ncbi:WcbI family polysaccharide biosynthesis putative acetyltransferase [Sphingomonas profundi]|uniref:WcbI family polysaccharide biosynthesis putative acetyltransferase n=1 Tax=Alterirhizorhabdus profundi TaxID=2681549 RepID=UPI0012E85BB7|nr:WcbI family polysaccharide biosynthesis putative acetyltransferase [Sphingomonas profundi]
MERWLLLSNCQTFGLANSFSLLNSKLHVDSADIWTFKVDAERYNREMADYDRVIVHPDIIMAPEFDASRAVNINHLPSIDFGAYHPDFGYFWIDGTFVNSPMTAYHSVIAVAAYNEGLSLADTRRLYNGRMYEACGYHRDWAPQRDALLRRYKDHGVDLAASFQHWGRGRAFMYSVNHPRIEELYQVARAFVLALGLPITETDIVPADNLIAGPCLPVYDEVGEMLGVRGSYLFKAVGRYAYVGLDTFLDESFAIFAGHGRHVIQPHPHYQPRYDQVLSVIRGQA